MDKKKKRSTIKKMKVKRVEFKFILQICMFFLCFFKKLLAISFFFRKILNKQTIPTPNLEGRA